MSDLAKKQTIGDMLVGKKKIVELIRRLFVLKEEFDKVCAECASYDYGFSGIVERGGVSGGFADEATAKQRVNEMFWKHFLKASGVSEMMTRSAYDSLSQKIERNPPEFCTDELSPILSNVQQFYGDNVKQTLQEVYDKLIDCGYHGGTVRKRSNRRKVEKNFRISTGCMGRTYRGLWQYEPWQSWFDYEDLYTACKILDGKRRMDYSDTFRTVADGQLKKGGDTVVTRYFSVKCFKNHNQLVKWIDLDVLSLLNRYGPKSASLPDSMVKRYKPEHFKEIENV